MNIASLLNVCTRAGIRLSTEAGELKLSAKKGAVTPQITELLSDNKQALIQYLKDYSAGDGFVMPRILPRDRRNDAPLSYAQQRLWFIDQLEGNGVQYNSPGYIELKGRLDADAFSKALESLLDRHEVLRTTFRVVDDEPRQVIADRYELTLTHHDFSGLTDAEKKREVQRLLNEEMRTPFDLENDLMLRVRIIKLSADASLMLYVMHHVATDGWSKAILMREFIALYDAYRDGRPNPLAPLKVQYADYALWQRQWLSGAIREEQIDYWRRHLAGISSTHSLPLDRPRPQQQTFEGKEVRQRISAALAAKIDALCQRHEVTLFMFLQTAFSVLASRYSSETDVVMGTYIAGRAHSDVEALIGFFVNSLVLRTDVSKNPRFDDLLRKNKRTILDAYAHQHVPFEMLVEQLSPERSLSHNPLFQISFSVHSDERDRQERKADRAAASVSTRFDLELNVVATTDGLRVTWLYNDSLFFEDSITRMSASYGVLLESICAALQETGAGQPGIEELRLMSVEDERKILVEWNDTHVDRGSPQCAHELFEQQAQSNPDKVAVIDAENHLTFQQLNESANQLAHYLKARGVNEGAVVAIYLEPSISFFIAVLGILKAGGVYLALDSNYPEARLTYMLGDSAAGTVVTRTALVNALPLTGREIVCLDAGPALSGYSQANLRSPSAESGVERAAYLIYTSGSTGKPKGVVGTHKSLTNRLLWMRKAYAETRKEVYCQKTSVGFVDHVAEIFQPLVGGFPTVIIPRDHVVDIRLLIAQLDQYSVTRITLVPSLLRELLKEVKRDELSCLTHVFSSGESLQADTISEFKAKLSSTALVNLYGSSEIGADVSHYDYSRHETDLSVIGRGIDNTRLYIVNDYLMPQPMGAQGQLYVAGDGLARGYHQQPVLTGERFVRNPFSSEAGSRLYRTGDLARWLPDGNVQFIGRRDDQVKIRGQRVEPAEIESELLKLHSVKNAVVVVQGTDGDRRLAAYVVLAETLVADHEGAQRKQAMTNLLKRQLEQQLPSYMVPQVYVYLDQLPLTASGKIDKKRLPEASDSDLQKQRYVAPRNETEKNLVDLWQSLLNVAEVGVDDNFFTLGGHSLLATRLISRIRQVFSVELPLRRVFEAPTIAGMSRNIHAEKANFVLPPMVRAGEAQKAPLSYAQQRLWFIDQLGEGSPEYNMSGAIAFDGPCNVDALKRAIASIVDRHQVLRTHFVDDSGEARQFVADSYEIPFAVHDLSNLDTDQQRAATERLYEEALDGVFDLSKDVMLRVVLLRFSESRAGLIYTMHHIAVDGWSKSLFQNELSVLYDAYSKELDNPLPPPKFQYADFALWQRSWLQGDVLNRQLEYWKERLAGIPATHKVPLDHPRPAKQSYAGATVRQEINSATAERIKVQCDRHDVTLFMFLETAFAVLLARYSNETDIVVGSPIAGRTHKDVEGLIGFFVNSLAIRTDVSNNPGFSELLKINKESILDAYANQHIPFEMLVEKLRPERHLNHNPLYQIAFAVQNNERGVMDLQAQRSRSKDKAQTSIPSVKANIRNDLELHVAEVDQRISIAWLYNVALFDRATIERMARHFRVLIHSVLQSLERETAIGIDDLEVLDEVEKRTLLVEWNDTRRDHPHEQCMHRFFEAHAAENPDRIALVYEGHQLSYAELNQRANGVAHYLIELGVVEDSIVLVCFERSLEMIIGLLAILKAGGAYVPMDPAHPPARLEYMCKDSGASIVLTHRRLLERVPIAKLKRIDLDTMEASSRYFSEEKYLGNPDLKALTADNLAYVLYTSGTTGAPKGVMVAHRGVTNLAFSLFEALPELQNRARSIWALNAGYYFDASLQAITQLMLGTQVVIVPESIRQSPEKFISFLRDSCVNVLDCTPSQLKSLMDVRNGVTLPALVIGGEKIGDHLWADLIAMRKESGSTIVNVYGLTETCVDSTLASISEHNPRETIGSYLANTVGYVLHKNRLVPIGVPGELHLGGAGLARGYLNRPELDQERFVNDPFVEGSTERLYKTGDLVRYLPDGQLQFIGRMDHQVKIRGFRLELGEIESVLAAHPSLHRAVVALNERADDKQLVAYVCPTPTYLDAAAVAFNQENLKHWTEVFDAQYRKSAPSQDASLNFVGWNSSYTGQPIELVQMEEWLSRTVDRIKALNPRRLLEIGSGTGLLLYRYAPWCEAVHALDISNAALAGVQRQLIERNWSHVRLSLGDALSTDVLGDDAYDTVVINSVAQYFPNRWYLEDAIRSLLPYVEEGGKILFGDIRNLDLLSAHVAAVERSRLSESTPVEVLANRAQRRIQQEPELLISPSFFAQLPERYPEIERVDILVKRGVGDNEMLRYRYEVVISKRAQSREEEAKPVDLKWIEFASTAAALEIIESGERETFGVHSYPNARIEEDLALADGLVQWQKTRRIYPEDDKGRLSDDSIQRVQALEDLLARAEASGYRCAVTWSQDHLSKLDLIFSHTALPPVRARSAYGKKWQVNYPQLATLGHRLSKDLKTYLAKRLPDYMVPGIYVAMEHLPINASGKVDRSALPRPLDSDLQREEHAAPRNSTEQRLCGLWQQLLKVKEVGIHDNFFALGGHSLLATRLISAIRREFAVELALTAIFEAPTIARLGERLSIEGNEFVLPPVMPADRSQKLPLSYAQQRLWFIDQLGGGSAQYNICHGYPLRGDFDSAAFERALKSLIDRHEVLRTRFEIVTNEPRQVIAEDYPLSIRHLDLSLSGLQEKRAHIETLILQEKQTPFDLSRDLMLRAHVIRMDAASHVVLFTLHHIASDGWSLGILRSELVRLYTAYRQNNDDPLQPLGVQYADYAVWQRQWLQGNVLDQQLQYWNTQLTGLPTVHSLPIDKPRQTLPQYAGSCYQHTLDSDTAARIKALCQRHDVTLYMFLQTAFAVLLGRYSGDEDIVVGCPVAGRTHKDVENLIGFFVNTLVLRTDLSGSPKFSELLKKNRKVILDAHAHQHIPFEMLVEKVCPERHLSHNALFQIVFSLQNAEQEGFELHGAGADLAESFGRRPSTEAGDQIRHQARRTTRFDLELSITEADGMLKQNWIYSVSLFDDRTIERWVKNYSCLLESIVAALSGEPAEEPTIDRLGLVSEQERRSLLREWSESKPPWPEDTYVAQLLKSLQRRSGEKDTAASAQPTAYILDDNRQLAPVGAVGDLYIGLPEAAESALDDDVLQAGNIIGNPFSGDARSRLYKTQDVVRWLVNGELAFVNSMREEQRLAQLRADLAGLQRLLSSHPHVENVAAIVKERPETDQPELIAYVVLSAGVEDQTSSEALAKVFGRFIRSQPERYLIPSSYRTVDALPLTPSGEIDKEALSALCDNDTEIDTYVAPRNTVESRLCEIWQILLQKERVGVNDDFFVLGGHSLLATRLISAIREEFSVELPISIIFDAPTVAALSLSISKRAQGSDLVLPPVLPVDRGQPLSLSYAQQRIWFIDQLGGGSVQYNVFGSFLLHGAFNVDAFKQALRSLLDRHEVLRTHFESESGEPRPVVVSQYDLPFVQHDLTDLVGEEKARTVQRLKRQESNTAFNLAEDLMLRVCVLTLSETKHTLLYTVHHVASDGWSIGILIRELKTLYEAYCAGEDSPLTPLKVQYADYAAWQRAWLEGEVRKTQLSYWQKQLADAPTVHKLPLDKPRPPRQTFQGRRYQKVLDGALTRKINTLREKYDVTLFVFLQTAFAVLLSRYSHEQDIIIGSPVSGRTHKDIEGLIGFFVNSLALRTNLAGNPRFSALLEAGRKNLLDAYAHQHVPFEMLVEKLSPERHPSHNPIFQTIFALQNLEHSIAETHDADAASPGETRTSAQSRELQTDRSTRFDLELTITETGDGLSQSWVYNSALFDEETIPRMAGHFHNLLDSIIDDLSADVASQRGIEQLELVNSAERQRLFQYGKDHQPDYPLTSHVHALLKTQHSVRVDRWRPMPYVFDEHLSLSPIGVPGQLHVTVAQADIAASRRLGLEEALLIPDPFSGNSADRLYPTGDIVRWTASGRLEFLGDIAERGRVQAFQSGLKDVEALLCEHPEVAEVAVLANQDRAEAIAFIVSRAGLSRSSEDLAATLGKYIRSQASRRVAPALFIPLESLPRTEAGNVDRQALIQLKASREKNYVPPRNEMEARMCRVWQDILKQETIGIYDNFFLLGGHSLLATRLISAVRHEFGVELPISAIFESPRLIELCQAVAAAGDDFVLPPIPPRAKLQEQLPDDRKEYEF